MEDSQIIALFFERSEQAIVELSNKYGKVCRRVSLNILKNTLDAEECVNDAYLGVWNNIPPQKPDPLLAYVCRIVRNLSIKRYYSNTALKRNSHYDIAFEELEDCIPSQNNVDEDYNVKELAKIINDFLSTLDKDNRVMFVRRYWFSDSLNELAKTFGITEHNASVRLSRIRGKLKKYLIKRGVIS
ncbi:RNA polymerase sigma factor [Konateibacter massiliensis]|uniref:RNA polymerase sigma factor n=1 Tax=Konateibacter massiliensis TaxID=2002841 RepID=UPI000C15451A|nr:sigma-70 family RNA polymerase sigma factor [Konateibacter massiliensis]